MTPRPSRPRNMSTHRRCSGTSRPETSSCAPTWVRTLRPSRRRRCGSARATTTLVTSSTSIRSPRTMRRSLALLANPAICSTGLRPSLVSPAHRSGPGSVPTPTCPSNGSATSHSPSTWWDSTGRVAWRCSTTTAPSTRSPPRVCSPAMTSACDPPSSPLVPTPTTTPPSPAPAATR